MTNAPWVYEARGRLGKYDKEAKDCTEERHCWHDTRVCITTWPGWSEFKCCHCGEKHTHMNAIYDDPFGHGPHHPMIEAE